MAHIIGGYKRSTGTLNVPVFTTSKTLQKLALNITSATIQKLGVSLGDNTHLIPEYVAIEDQLSLNACVANATVAAFEILKGIEDPSAIQVLSRLYLYWNARSYTNDTNVDQGTYIHNALDSLTKMGVCEETLWPYDPSEVFVQPPIAAYKEGNDNTITTFYQIITTGDARLNDIEVAIRANHPVIFGTTVGADFEAYTGATRVFDIPTQPIGGHALLITGVRTNVAGQREFYVRNSWGPNWGLGGHIWVSSNYMTWSETNDLFVATRMNNLLA